MQLRIGIVGLPNAGKSTLFNALLKKQVADAAAYPFCTIEPNVGVVPVPDERLLKLAEITKEEEKMDKLPPIVPAVVEFVDIAGLVAGASKGEGLGNKFLSHIREVDIICHVVRNFADSSVVHVAGEINPLQDKDIIETELILADLQTLENQTSKSKNQNDKSNGKDILIAKLKQALNDGQNARDVVVSPEEQEMVRDLHLLSMKPVLYVMNVDEQEINTTNTTNNTNITNEWRNENNVLSICAKTESELVSLTSDEQKEYLAALGVEVSGLDLLIQKTYAMLGLISFLTCGVKEVRAWTIPLGMKAPQAAGVIHTDFEKKFIKADCVSYTDFVAVNGPASTRGDASLASLNQGESTRGGWKAAKEQGKVRQEGKEYVMRDGDVVEFKIGT